MKVLTLIVGLTLFAGGPVLAQQANGTAPYGYTPPPGTPLTPDNQGGNGAIPPVGRQIKAARNVEKVNAGRQPSVLLRQADQALTRRKIAVSNELLERAQTAALNTQGDTSKLAAAIQDARQAVVANDMTTAHQRIADAIGMLPASHR